MVGITIFILTLIILTTLLFTAMGSEITIGLDTLLWVGLASFISGAIWMIILIVSSVGERINQVLKFKN